jgi:hypothetical protein
MSRRIYANGKKRQNDMNPISAMIVDSDNLFKSVDMFSLPVIIPAIKRIPPSTS